MNIKTAPKMPEYSEWMGSPMWREHLLGDHHNNPREDCADCMTRVYMPKIHDAYFNGTPEQFETIYSLSDGYGVEGLIPDQGYDWSGVRDSSPAAILRMAQALGLVS